MKAFTKLLAVLLTLCMLVTCLAACSSTEESEPKKEKDPTTTTSTTEAPIEDDPIDDEPIEEEEPTWEDPYEEEEEEEEEEPEIPELSAVAMKLARPRVATPSKGMPVGERVTYILSPVDLGADRTGQIDCTEEIVACLKAAEGLGGGVVYLPAGYYRVESNEINIPKGVSLVGEWLDPTKNDMSKVENRGTVLMAYQPVTEGNAVEEEIGFISMQSSATLKNISVWHPEQDATNPQLYPYTIKGAGHTNVINVTLYNSYRGFYNAGCSSMLIRGFYGTVLNQGIYGAEAYDIPRIEKVVFDTNIWAKSGLPNAPTKKAEVQFLENYCHQNVIGLKAGRMDWGYWYDIYTNNVRYAVQLIDGNDSIGKLVTRNTKVGVYIENMSYPGLSMSYCDIDATQAAVYYISDGNETLSVSTSTLGGSDNIIRAVNTADYGLSFSQCTFKDWEDSAIYADAGSINISNTKFEDDGILFNLGNKVPQVLLVGNTIKGTDIVTGDGWSSFDKRITRADDNKDIPVRTDNYNYEFAPTRRAATGKVFNVADYGAVHGDVVKGTKIYKTIEIKDEYGDVTDTKEQLVTDSTAAIQKALNAAGQAGGGVVALHGGYYRVDGALTVPTGVELKGTFEGPHFGNGTMAGTQIFAYGGKNQANGKPLISMAKGSGVNGITVYYPEQGLSDKAVLAAEKVKVYPATIRANADCWIKNVCFTGCWIGVDAMTNNCSNIVISDVTGATMHKGLVMGHGTNGGWVQNFHFNYSSWSGEYNMAPDGNDSGNKVKNPATNEMDWVSRGDLLTEYTRKNVTGVELGDCKNVKFFSCFSIIIHTQIKLIEDPYTKGSFDGTMWGFAFDACHDGIRGESGNGRLDLYESMGVFNQGFSDGEGGHNVNTSKNFTGTISVWNTDSWSPNSKGIAYVEGGTVNYVQCFPWCVYNGEVFDGATLNVLGTVFVANNGNKYNDASGNQIRVPDVTYHAGSTGKVVGTLSCKQDLNIIVEPGANVIEQFNGIRWVPSAKK